MTREELESDIFDMIDKTEEGNNTRQRGLSKSLDHLEKVLQNSDRDQKHSIQDLCKSTSSLSYIYEDPNLLEFNANVFWKTDAKIQDLVEID